MVALFVILTFTVMILIDHLLLRQPVVLAPAEERKQPRPRIVPAVVAGFAIPDHLRYHPGHTWALAESPELVRVGMDDFAAKIGGDVGGIEIPERGQWIRQGQKIISMHRDGRDLELVSPIEGTVVDVNDAVLRDPAAARKDPYGEGWLLTVNSPDAKTNFRNLLSGKLARRWMDDSAARLRAIATEASGAFAQDGGLAAENLVDQLTPEHFEQINRELFLA